MTLLKTRTSPWFLLAAVLVVLGLFVVRSAAGSIILAVGLVAAFGGCISLISRHDQPPRDEPRVPAGHSGV